MAQSRANDWQSRKTLSECNRYMLENEVSCDVTFLVGDEKKRILAHRYVLVSRSSVFQAMFCGPLAEKDEEIVVPDVPVSAFQCLLRYIYFEETQLVPNSVLGVFYAAKKYAIAGLEDQIVSWLKENITAESVCTIFDQAAFYDNENLEEKCLTFVKSHADVAFSSDGFRDLTNGSLRKLLTLNSLQIEEEKVFEAALEWSKAECIRKGLNLDGASKREVLGEAIYSVRFPLLSSKYFAKHVVDQEILNTGECTQIFQTINGVPKPHLKFSSTPRSSRVNKISRFASHKADDIRGWAYRAMADCIDLSCDKSALVHGIGLYGSRHGPGSYNVNVRIEQNGTLLGQTSADFETSEETKTYPVMFSEAVSVMAETRIRIVAKITGPNSFYGNHGKATIKMNDCTFSFAKSLTAGDTCNGTNVDTGQIPEIFVSIPKLS